MVYMIRIIPNFKLGYSQKLMDTSDNYSHCTNTKSELLLHFNRAMLPTERTFTRFPVVKLLLLGGSSESCFR